MRSITRVKETARTKKKERQPLEKEKEKRRKTKLTRQTTREETPFWLLSAEVDNVSEPESNRSCGVVKGKENSISKTRSV